MLRSRECGNGRALGPSQAGLLLALSALGACGETDSVPPGSLDGPRRAEVDTLGDTVVVRTLAGSEWGRARLVEELRIGRVEGEEHEMFGQIGALAVAAGGEMLVYDAHATAVRRYGADGRYLGTIGGVGSGPGEYRNVAGMAALDDGRIVLNDFGNGRFNVYSPDGNPLATWLVHPAIAERRPLHTHAGGGIFLHDLRLREGGTIRDEVLVRLGKHGEPGDTTLIPYADYRPPALEVQTERTAVGTAVPFTPSTGWSVTADGELVAFSGDRYAVDVHRAARSVLRITRAVEPVAVSAEERAAEEARVTAFFARFVEGWRWDGPAIPATKPPVLWVHTGRDSTIWVRIAQPGTAIPDAERTRDARTFVREPVVFDIFDTEGRYLGQVHAPDGIQLDPYPVFDRDHVWAVVQDGTGVDFLARLRIVRE